MAVIITIGGKSTFTTNTYQVTEDATPIDPSSTNGGTGTFTIGTNELTGDKGIINQMLMLSDGAQGITQGSIDTSGGDSTILTLTGSSLLNSLNATVTANPYSGTLGGAFAYYLGLVGITTGFLVDSTITSRAVVFPGWYANAWDQMKQLCAGQQVEVTLVSDLIVMRPIRQNVAQTYRDETLTWNMDQSAIAQEVNIFYYNSVANATGLAYPLSGASVGAQIYQVDANETLVVNIPLTPSSTDGTGTGSSLASVLQPVATDNVAEFYTGSTSVYSIIDQNNNAYPAAKWVAGGGSVSVAIGSDTQSLVVTINGPSDTSLAPYRLALPVDITNQEFFNTLNIVGNGVFYNKKLLTVPTGLSLAQTANVSGAVMDDFAINTYQDAVTASLSALASAVGPVNTIQVSTHGINTKGNAQNYTLVTFGQFDAVFGGHTFGFADTLLTPTFAAADAYLFSLVKSSFTNQAFGNVAGARRFYDNSWYRITSATLTPDGVQYAAVMDNTFADWDAVWGSKTFSAWDAIWGGKTFLNLTGTPLKAA